MSLVQLFMYVLRLVFINAIQIFIVSLKKKKEMCTEYIFCI